MSKPALVLALVVAGVLVLVPLLVAVTVAAIAGPAGATILAASCLGDAPAAGPRQLRIVQANEYVGLTPSQFADDLATLSATGADFITLNEAYARSDRQLTATGYDAWRATSPRDARETPVLWRADRWAPLDHGTLLLHHASLRGGTRYANWVTLRTLPSKHGHAAVPGATVSVISVHELQSQTTPRRRALAVEGLRRLADLIDRLRTSGPVLAGGDFNVQYHHSTRPASQPDHSPVTMLAGHARSTYQTLGKPPRGWATGDGGGTIDYLFHTSNPAPEPNPVPGMGLRPDAHDTLATHSDHDALWADFTLGGPPAAPSSGVHQPLPAAPVPAAPIPTRVRALYETAASTYAVPWTLLAGIGMEETTHGRTTAAINVSSAGARGLMQFLPTTWATYGIDGDGDGRAEITNDADSISSAAHYLTSLDVTNGPSGVRRALRAYNHADWYVNDVLYYAHQYGGGTVTGSPQDCESASDAGNPALPPLDSGRVAEILGWGMEQLGEPYVFGATGPNAWDCSSFTQAAYAQAATRLPRTAQTQRDWLAAGNGYRVQLGHERPGDLVFTDTYRGPNAIGHVMLVFNPTTHLSLEAGGDRVQHLSYTRYQNHHIFEIWRVGNLQG